MTLPIREEDGLSNFLLTSKTKYLEDVTNGKGREWTVVMGNEAGDLDSIASSIAYAWVQYTTRQIQTIALIQTQREDLPLRAENIYALQTAGLSKDLNELLCINDIPLPCIPFPSNTFAIVDHNVIAPSFLQDNPGATVVAIIDHHADEEHYKDASLRKIMPVGSCASMVAQFCQPAPIPSALAVLLLSAILLDTSGLKPGAKAKDVDYAAASYLVPLALPAGVPTELALGEALFTAPPIKDLSLTLETRKNDITDMPVWDLLRRDYKQYTLTTLSGITLEAGLSTIPVAMKFWIKRGEFEAAVNQWMDQRQLSVLGLLTTFRHDKKKNKNGDGKRTREQVWVVRDSIEHSKSFADSLWEGLEESKALELEHWKKHEDHLGDLGSKGRAKIYLQGNTDATRKVTAPLLKSIIENIQS